VQVAQAADSSAVHSRVSRVSRAPSAQQLLQAALASHSWSPSLAAQYQRGSLPAFVQQKY